MSGSTGNQFRKIPVMITAQLLIDELLMGNYSPPSPQRGECPRWRVGARETIDNGSAMKIHRSPSPDDSTPLPNALLQDQRLSYAARGVLAELLSRDSGHDLASEDLWQAAQQHRSDRAEGRRAIRSALAELEAAGYLVRRRTQGQRGRWETSTDLYDTPGHMDPA